MAQTDPFPDVEYNTQYNMSITGQVRINGEALPDGTIVAVYCHNEIRGKEEVFSQGKRKNVFSLTIKGETEGDPLHFKVFTNGCIIEVDQGNTFIPDGEIGSLKDYYYIDLPSPVVTAPSTEGWATTCLPFNAEVPEGVTVWYATGVENGELVMSESTGSILPKDTPVLLESNGLTGYEWLSRVADGDVSTPGSIFKGTTEATAVEAGSVLTLGHSKETGDIGFWSFTGTTLPANRAYIASADIPAGVRGVKIVSGGATGIQELDGRTISPFDNSNEVHWYSLDGRRLSGTPTVSGIYVRQGKKLIIK